MRIDIAVKKAGVLKSLGYEHMGVKHENIASREQVLQGCVIQLS